MELGIDKNKGKGSTKPDQTADNIDVEALNQRKAREDKLTVSRDQITRLDLVVRIEIGHGKTRNQNKSVHYEPVNIGIEKILCLHGSSDVGFFNFSSKHRNNLAHFLEANCMGANFVIKLVENVWILFCGFA